MNNLGGQGRFLGSTDSHRRSETIKVKSLSTYLREALRHQGNLCTRNSSFTEYNREAWSGVIKTKVGRVELSYLSMSRVWCLWWEFSGVELEPLGTWKESGSKDLGVWWGWGLAVTTQFSKSPSHQGIKKQIHLHLLPGLSV